MKLFNTLKAGTSGKVVRFLVENGAMVEFDQPLLLVDPRAAG
jgi:biotin carboxyl carrier protein